MQDPNPENITGSKTVTHSYTHRIDWGYVAAGVGMLAVAYVAYRIFGPDPDDEESGLLD